MVEVHESNTGRTEEDRVDNLEYLTFCIGVECFGVDILKVQAIRAWEDVTRIPNAAEYVMGVLNLRGLIVPVYDLRLRIGMEFRKYEEETVVIILKAMGNTGERNIGVVVDEVSDVLLTNQEEIKGAPDFGCKMDARFISGITTVGEKLVTLLQVDMLQPPEQQRKEVAEMEIL
jgi:purine-binding chemotaxis protein CheW